MIHILQDSFRLFFRFCLKVFRPRARKKEKTDWSICGILQTRLMRVRISQISFKFHVALLKLFHETQHGARTYPIDLSDVSKLRSRHSRLDMLWITAGSKLQGRSRRKTEYLLAKIGFDTAENEPCKDLQEVCKILQDLHLQLFLQKIFQKRFSKMLRAKRAPLRHPLGTQQRKRRHHGKFSIFSKWKILKKSEPKKVWKKVWKK